MEFLGGSGSIHSVQLQCVYRVPADYTVGFFYIQCMYQDKGLWLPYLITLVTDNYLILPITIKGKNRDNCATMILAG
jgi:hypothetical protein